LDRDLDRHKASTCTGQNKEKKKKTEVHPQKEEDSKLATELLVFIKPSVPCSTWKSFHLYVVSVVWEFLRNFIPTCVAKGSAGNRWTTGF
jgi:hypothetical protein